MQLPEYVAILLEMLEKEGHEAYTVGGCVRDSLLGRTPQDWDITTSASPEEVKRLFPRTVDTGIQHGTVTVLTRGGACEVTTYRVDGAYRDGRHPEKVQFTHRLEEDLKRRDFTINAMAYHPERGLVDLFGGRADLDNHVIRCVGEPEDRFAEDALRILRAIRFSAQLGFSIENATWKAVEKLRENLRLVSHERIQVELVKLLISDHPQQFRLLYEAGITHFLVPDFDVCMETTQNNPYHCYSVGEHTLVMLPLVPPDKVLRLSVLFHDLGKPQTQVADANGIEHFPGHGLVSEKIAEAFLKEYRFDNDTIKKVCHLIHYHDYPFRPDAYTVRKALSKVGQPLFLPLLCLMEADTLGKSTFTRQDRLDDLKTIHRIYERILARGECFSLKDLAITGRDLLDLGFSPGPELGKLLNELLERVLEHPEWNSRETLSKYLQEKYEL